jgi:general L-amino acid transport system substrate-binding protein
LYYSLHFSNEYKIAGAIMKKLKTLLASLGLASILLSTPPVFAGTILDKIRANGEVNCGVGTGVAGFSMPDSSGKWIGLTADFCRAVSSAVLGQNARERFIPLQVDLLSSGVSWTLTRDASLGLLFAGVYFYDGQGFLANTNLNLAKPEDLNGATICTAGGTTSELNLADFMRSKNIDFKAVVYESAQEAKTAFLNGRCQILTADISYLSSVRASDTSNPADWEVLDFKVSKEPLGPVVSRTDLDWFTINKWTLTALVAAEEMNITSENIDELLKSKSPTVQRFLGTSGDIGSKLGLDNSWAYNIIKRVGNYGEIYERNVGVNTPLMLERGQNALAANGGLMYALPIR